MARFSAPEVEDHTAMGEFSTTTRGSPRMVVAAAMAHWQDDAVDRLNCRTSGRSRTNMARCRARPRRSFRSTTGGSTRVSVPGRCEASQSTTRASTPMTVTLIQAGSAPSTRDRFTSAPPRVAASE